MTWEIKIRRAENGFILTHEVEGDEGSPILIDSVYEDAQEYGVGETEKRGALIQVFREVIDYFNLEYQKHHNPKEKFIKISLVEEEKYFDEEEGEDHD